MKINKLIISVLLILLSGLSHSQISIGNSSPDASAILNLSSTTKGLLIPRMTTLQQINIVNPTIGLMIYNTTNGQLEINKGDGHGGYLWTNKALNGTTAELGTNTTKLATTAFVRANTGYSFANEIAPTKTSSTTDILANGMLLSPPPGIYSVTFNSEYNNDLITTIGTAQCVHDLEAAYNHLTTIPITNSMHVPVMGNGETFFPGVYSIGSAASIGGTLTLDGQGNQNSLFIFKIGGAFACGAVTNVVLTNGAEARNIFWIVEGAISIGASSTMKGTMIAHAGAGAVGASCILEGRLFSMAGALSFGPAVATVPSGLSQINLGGLTNFAMFTSTGAISNTAGSTITGNIGTNLGAITGFEISTINGTIYNNSASTIIENNVNNFATFSIYQNGTLIPSSTKKLISNARTANISLQAIATITAGQPIEVRWKTASARISMGNRTLTAIKVQ